MAKISVTLTKKSAQIDRTNITGTDGNDHPTPSANLIFQSPEGLPIYRIKAPDRQQIAVNLGAKVRSLVKVTGASNPGDATQISIWYVNKLRSVTRRILFLNQSVFLAGGASGAQFDENLTQRMKEAIVLDPGDFLEFRALQPSTDANPILEAQGDFNLDVDIIDIGGA